ncbi:MAG: MATE family efflux transporter [Bacilli bacterium]|nr:MATE family efflux transporter [Bacilli bacterium]
MESRLANTKDMTKGSIWKHIILFALPIFISSLFQQLYNSVDSLIVGNFIDNDALAAVSSSGNLIFLFTSFFIGMFMGGGVVIANYFGKKDYDSMQKAIHTNITIALISSVLLTIIGVFGAPIMLKLMDTPVEVLPKSIEYFRYYFLGISGTIMYNCLNGTLQAVGNSRRGLYYLVFSSVLNILLDLLFIGAFHMGVGAAGLATSISQICSALLCLGFLSKPGTVYHVQLKKLCLDKEMVRLIIKFGIPSGIQNSVIAVANVLVQKNINSFGDIAMAGCGTYSKIEGFAFTPINCFTMAISTFVSQNLGAKEYDRAKKGARFGILCSISMAEIIGIITYFTIPFLAGLFTKETASIEYSIKQARTISLFYCLLAYSHCVSAVCRGGGKPIVPMLVMLLDWCLLRVTYITIAMNINHDITLIFWAYPITWAISSVFYLFYYYLSDWVHGYEKRKISN